MKDLLEQNLTYLGKQVKKLPLGSSEQKVALAEYEKLLAKYNDYIKEENASKLKAEELSTKAADAIAEQRIQNKELDRKERELSSKILQDARMLRVEKCKTILTAIAGIGGAAASVASGIFGWTMYRKTVKETWEYEKDGIVSSSASKQNLGLFKPKM